MSGLPNVSRRRFLESLAAGGAFVVVGRFVPDALAGHLVAQAIPFTSLAASSVFHPSVYLGIQPDGRVIIVTHRSEMGTGIRTSLPLVAADELEADWGRVTVEQGIGDPRYGDQNTDGSRSIRDFYEVFRRAGATARTMLVSAAAAQWQVPASECVAINHEVVHSATKRRLGYGALASAAASLASPAPEAVQLKPKSAFRYIGKPTSIVDEKDIVTGKAQFGLDVFREGMVHATIEHPPVMGSTVRTLDDKQTLAVRGVRQTVLLDTLKPPYMFKPLGGVAVIADSTWAALQGRRQLKVDWQDSAHASFESDAFKRQMMETARSAGRVARSLGDVDAAFARGGKVIEAMYYTPLAAHASMEPPAAVAEFKDGKVTIWAPTQNPQAVQETVGAVLGIDKQHVTCHVTLLGGGFGRKSKPDYVAEAALLSKQLGKPVKVVWTREDDLKFDYYHSTAAVYQKAAVDARGRPTAWLQRSVFPPIAAMFDPTATHALPFELELGLVDLPYDVPNLRMENGAAAAHVRIGWFRAVANNYHAFAAQSFVDEMAHAAGRDPLEFQLDLLGPTRRLDFANQGFKFSNYDASLDKYPFDTGRLRAVIELAADKAGWGKRKPGNGWGMGLAAHRSFNTYVASVVEVEVDDRGQVRVPRVHQAVDAGTIVNPDRVRAQFEGAAVMAVGMARTGEITAANGRIQQGNFGDFRVARMNDAPYQTDVHLIDNDHPPAGVGEPGVPPVLAAFANAIFAATGRRVRELPLSRHKLV
jgi:isoquinoline 1-oxidoreductase subunit beta